jgi:hypothetical protein
MADPDLQYFGQLELDPHLSENLDADPHYS